MATLGKIIGWALSVYGILALGGYLIPQYIMIKSGVLTPGEYHSYFDAVVSETESIQMILVGVTILIAGTVLIAHARRATNNKRNEQGNSSEPSSH